MTKPKKETEKKVKVISKSGLACPNCDGRGGDSPEDPCDNCKGTGQV